MAVGELFPGEITEALKRAVACIVLGVAVTMLGMTVWAIATRNLR
jgi:hypothetical protein